VGIRRVTLDTGHSGERMFLNAVSVLIIWSILTFILGPKAIESRYMSYGSKVSEVIIYQVKFVIFVLLVLIFCWALSRVSSFS